MISVLAAAQGVDWAAALSPLYYGIGILALIVSGLWALKRYADHQRQQNIIQGNTEQKLTDTLDAVVVATEKNTLSIDRLSAKFDEFSSNMDKRITLADYRIGRLENGYKPGGPPPGI